MAEGDLQEESPKRRQILDGARDVFMQHGFEGASMRDIAREAGVSKGTLYVYFENKESMFGQLISEECDLLRQSLRDLLPGEGAVEQELQAVAVRLAELGTSDKVIGALRMIIGAAGRFPEQARMIYGAGPERTADLLAGYFEMRRSRGELVMDDCMEAAREFLDLTFAGLQRRALLMKPMPSPEEVQLYLGRRVAIFLRAYAPQGNAGSDT